MNEYTMADISNIGPRIVEIKVPWIGPSLNKVWAGIHYRVRTKLAANAHIICLEHMKNIPPFTTPVHLEFTPTMGKVGEQMGPRMMGKPVSRRS